MPNSPTVHRVVLSGVAAVLLGLSSVTVAPAAAAPATVLTGKGGTFTYVTLARATAFFTGDHPLLGVSATSGGLAGIALDRPGAWATYTTGRTDAGCPFAAAGSTCPVAHVPKVVAKPSGVPLAPGRYRLTLIGESSGRVTVRFRPGVLSGRSGRWGDGFIVVDRLPSPTGLDHDAVLDDRVFFATNAATTVVGSVVRADLDNAAEARFSFCARSRGLHDTLPGGVVCNGDDVISTDAAYSSGKGACAGCFPLAAPFSLTDALSAVFPGAGEVRLHARAVAQRSRLTATSYYLSLPAFGSYGSNL